MICYSELSTSFMLIDALVGRACDAPRPRPVNALDSASVAVVLLKTLTSMLTNLLQNSVA